MIRRLVIMFLGLGILVAAPDARAQSYGTELPFVLGTGARASGLGLAAVSLADDASIQYHNPAGLGYLQWKQFLFYRTTLFDSKSVYHSLSYAHPLLNYGTLAISVMRLDVGGVEQRDNTNRLLPTDLHNSQTRILLGYAKDVTSSVSAGFNIKIDNQSFGDYSGSGVGMDIGLLAKQDLSGDSFIKGFREGLAVQNLLEPSLKLDQDKVSDPINLALGVSAISGFRNMRLVTSLDVLNPRYSPVDFRFGQEVVYADRFALRFGMDDATPTFGFGGRFKQLALDYAYRSEDIGNNHRISLTVKFGSPLSERKMKARVQLENEVNTTITIRMADLEQTQIERALQQGDSLFVLEEYGKAVSRFEMALLWDPDNDHAIDYVTKSRYRQAISLAEQSIDDDDYVQGLFHANRALSFVPADSTASKLSRRCNEEIETAQNKQAFLLELLKTSIDLYADRRFADALTGFEETLRISPDNSLAREYRGKCRMSIDEHVGRLQSNAAARAATANYDGAIAALESALVYKPNDPGILGEIDNYKNRRREAARVALQPTPVKEIVIPKERSVGDKMLDQNYRRGMKLFDEGDFDEAIKSFLKVWTVDPDYYNVSALLTKAYLFVGMRLYADYKYTEAIEMWQKSLAIDPGNNKAKRYLSKADEELQKLSSVYHGR